MKYGQAHEIAIDILKRLEPLSTKIDIVGSVRREKAEVHDIELCVVPRLSQKKDLFGEVLGTERLHSFIKEVKCLGIILKGKIEDGRMVQIRLPEDIVLDLFLPVESDYYRQVAIRTGSKDYSHKVLAVAWLKKGYCGTDDGLRLQKECYQKLIGKYPDGRDKSKWFCNNPEPTLAPIFDSEYELYKWLSLEWIEPKNRNV